MDYKSEDEDLTYYEFQRIINNANQETLISMRKTYESQLFDTLKCYHKNKRFEHQIQRRINQFVFSPGIPYPYQCDNNNRQELETYLEHLVYSIELIKGAKETVKLLCKQRKGNYCPYLLFIPMSNNPNQHIYTYSNHQKHLLCSYTSKIIKESQHCLEFHITSHGNHEPPSIDTMNPIKELLPNEFATKFHSMLVNGNVYNILKDKRIKFTFHICNGAYCEIGNEEMEEICEKIRTETFIGQFRAQMIKYGYQNIVVTGYRGYYQMMMSGSGVRVGNRLTNATKDMDCRQVEYTIGSDGCVDIPKCYKFEIESETEHETDTESVEDN